MLAVQEKRRVWENIINWIGVISGWIYFGYLKTCITIHCIGILIVEVMRSSRQHICWHSQRSFLSNFVFKMVLCQSNQFMAKSLQVADSIVYLLQLANEYDLKKFLAETPWKYRLKRWKSWDGREVQSRWLNISWYVTTVVGIYWVYIGFCSLHNICIISWETIRGLFYKIREFKWKCLISFLQIDVESGEEFYLYIFDVTLRDVKCAKNVPEGWKPV